MVSGRRAQGVLGASDGSVLEGGHAGHVEVCSDHVGEQAQPAAAQHRNQREAQVVEEVQAQGLTMTLALLITGMSPRRLA